MSRFPALGACALAALLAIPSTTTAADLDPLHAMAETAPNYDDEAGGDADADDPAIWRIPLSRKGFGKPVLVDKVREYGQPATYDEATEECTPTGPPPPEAGTHLSADAEGLTIAYGHRRTLLASSQGDSTYARYDITRGGLRYRSGFEVTDGEVDSVEHSDGAAITTTPLGHTYPNGLLVLHDGENTPDEGRTNTNFKLLDARPAIGR